MQRPEGTLTEGAAPIFFIHGAYCDQRIWQPQVSVLSRKYEVHAVNLPGSFPDRDLSHFSAEQHISFLANSMRKLNRPVHLVGHSRGGRIALHLAAALPENTVSLTLIEPGGAMTEDFLSPRDTNSAQPSWAVQARDTAMRLLERGATTEAAREYLNASQGPRAWDLAPKLFRDIAPRNMHTLRAIISDDSAPLSRQLAKRIRTRCLLVQGQKSPVIFHRILDTLEEELAVSQRTEISDAGHFLPVSHSAEFNTVLEEFVKDAHR